MRKIFSLILVLAILCFAAAAQAATVTEARWGVHTNDVLRLVISVDKPVTYNVRLENGCLRVLVNADVAAAAKGTQKVRSNLAESMTMQKEGYLAVLQVPLKQSLTTDNYKTFVLRQDASGKTPYRIVVDLNANQAAKPVVGTQPLKKPANEGSTWTPSGSSATSNGSWTDRFKKPGTTVPKLTPSERVKQSIEQAKNAAREKQQAQKPPTAVASKPASDTAKTPAVSGTSDTAKTPAVSGASTTQGDLKRILNAKRAARLEAAAEAAEKKKKGKASKETAVATKNTVDGLVVIKGSGKYKTSGGLKDKVITLDAGHGGSDPGAIGLGGTMEKNLTLPITKRVAELLTKAGAKVHMTRTDDRDVHSRFATDKQELQARVNVAEKYSSDLFVSVHINSSVNRDINGVSSYYYPKTSQDARIARCIQKRLVAKTGMNDLAIREAGFYVIKRNSMPATLLEMGFISNKKEEALMRTASYQEKAAQAIFEGIKDYFG